MLFQRALIHDRDACGSATREYRSLVAQARQFPVLSLGGLERQISGGNRAEYRRRVADRSGNLVVAPIECRIEETGDLEPCESRRLLLVPISKGIRRHIARSI